MFYATYQKLYVESLASITDYFSLDVFGYGITPVDVAVPVLKVNIDALPVTKQVDLLGNFAPLFDKNQRWAKAPGQGRFCLQLNLNVNSSLDTLFMEDYLRETYDVAQALKCVIKEVDSRGGAVKIYAWQGIKKSSFNLREHMDNKVDWDNGIE
jgi:hypothetical protein